MDDNADAADTLAMVLSLQGHEVRVARNGNEAMAAADEHCPDVVILDIGLPGIDGYEVARRLRGRAQSAKVVMIALTGYGRQEDVDKARAAGFDHHLVKPVEPAAVVSLLSLQRPGAA